MIQIERDRIYVQGNYEYKNFTSLTKEEKLMVLGWRNDDSIRKHMYNSSEIDVESHLKFIDSLSSRDDCFYWLVFSKNKPVGVVSVTDVNYDESICESGYYVSPDHNSAGFCFDFFCNYLQFKLQTLGFEKLVGCISVSNLFSINLSTFFSYEKVESKLVDGQEYSVYEINRANFLENLPTKTINAFARHIRNRN